MGESIGDKTMKTLLKQQDAQKRREDKVIKEMDKAITGAQKILKFLQN